MDQFIRGFRVRVHSRVASLFTKTGRACSGQEGGEGSLVASVVQTTPAAADELPGHSRGKKSPELGVQAPLSSSPSPTLKEQITLMASVSLLVK